MAAKTLGPGASPGRPEMPGIERLRGYDYCKPTLSTRNAEF